AVVRKGLADGHTLFGYTSGWAGVLNGDGEELTAERTKGVLPRGGTILGSSRTNPFKKDGGGVEAVRAGMERFGVDVPETIDNDLKGTDYTFGFQTAVQIATDAVDRLHTTAESHNRVMVLEVMGRHAGWIAVHSGLAGGADVILVPERPFDIDDVCSAIRRRHAKGANFSIVVVAE